MASVRNETTEVMWKPKNTETSNMDHFRRMVNRNYGLNLEHYHDLWKWSVEQYSRFWESFWLFSNVIHSQPYKEVVDTSKRIDEIPEWFPGARLNYAENLLRYEGNKVALYTAGEGQNLKSITFSELKQNVATLASALRNLGIKKGDRVVGYIPNCALAIEAMLATTSIGAIWSSTSPDFGVTGVLDRFTQIKPKIIFSVNAVRYNNKIHNHLEKLHKVVEGLPQLEKVVVFPFVGSENEVEISHIPNSIMLSEFVKFADESPQLEFEQVPFNHPLFIMYSSGTTGAPKCIVHSVGGTLIQHLKEHVLHGNMTKDDIICYYTTTGWMMWNWLVSSIATGASVVLYDGSPFIPNGNVLWDLVDQLGITILGTGAKWIQAIEAKKIQPKDTHKLSSLHTILSTGSPLKPSSYDYVYHCIKDDVLLGSITGGTDIISCFAGQNCTIPVYRGEIQARNLGMAVESWDDEGKPVLDVSGDLVCTKPFPCMPTSFWNDPNGLKYKKAYFSKFTGVWSHGDFCSINSTTGGILMLGRSDGTLNPNGVRFGSAEIYNIVEQFDEVEDSLCVGQQTKDGERVVLFLKLVTNKRLDDDLLSRIRVSIRNQLSARHVPAIILETKEIPYTTSGKKIEVAVKKIISGQQVTNRGALANPNSLDLYNNIPELQTT
ncbi:acetoacetyl-CoA synthetase [Exaiptasia diaphana]|uniref:Acetoacetyl-CoA synthetase n=1 Tax=Exaiptasia diaphana TaxID=2652724 RepID=A0A913Y4N9_EXADI|nr:acetoacetyl-CoA synthetase [Exaiptasia diaphana]KXJ28939.1 Acetoacetyl-CoA synthetase [Exaiptasia diaphana]